MHKKIATFISAIVLAACNDQSKTSEVLLNGPGTAKQLVKEPGDQPLGHTRKFATQTGMIISIIEEHPRGQSMSTIKIVAQNLNTDTLVVEDSDPLSEVLMGDLDKNGFSEMYLITRSAGSGSYADVKGFASNRDKSLSEIVFPEITAKDLAASNIFEGYMGHDLFDIVGNKLVRTFPLYKKDSANIHPSGVQRKVCYSLKKGEASWKLEVFKIENCEIGRFYSSSDGLPKK